MKKRAFTLVELLIVVVIIGILATIVTLALSSYAGKAKDAKTKAAIEEVQKAIQLKLAEEGGTIPADCATGSFVAIKSRGGGACLSTPTGLGLTSAPVDSKGNPIQIKSNAAGTAYTISGRGIDDKCFYVTATSKEGLSLPSSSPTYCP